MAKPGRIYAALTPTERVAIGCVLVSASGIAAWFTAPGLRAWTPSVVVGAISIAVTITVVERAVRKESRLRLSPRAEFALDQIRGPLKWLMLSVATDLETCFEGELDGVPGDVVALTDMWIDAENVNWQTRRALPSDGEPPSLASEAARLMVALQETRRRDGAILEPDLIRAFDEFAAEIDRAIFLYETVDAESRTEARSSLAILTRSVVYAAHNLALDLAQQDPDLVQIDLPARLVAQHAGDRVRSDRPPRAA